MKIRFERSGRGQEPSRGHKFSILENFLSIRDFTSQTLASFPSDLVGVALVGASPSICCRRPRCRLKAPLGLSLLRCASQTRSHPKPCLERTRRNCVKMTQFLRLSPTTMLAAVIVIMKYSIFIILYEFHFRQKEQPFHSGRHALRRSGSRGHRLVRMPDMQSVHPCPTSLPK